MLRSHWRPMTLLTCVSLVAIVAGCGRGQVFGKNDSNNDSAPSYSGPTGCVQGVVVDGVTDEKIKIPNTDQNRGLGVFALVQDQVIPAIIKTSPGDAEKRALDGEYSICGLPYNNTYPLFAGVEGYESFQGYISVDRQPYQQGYTEKYQESLHRTVEANIRLYKVGTVKQDLRLRVVNEGVAVADANVELSLSTDLNIVAETSTSMDRPFVAPSNVRHGRIITKTDGKGIATIPAAQLVLGAYYSYQVTPSADARALGIKKAASAIVYGPRTKAIGLTDAFDAVIDLANIEPELKVVSVSGVNPNGNLELVFNYPVEVYTLNGRGISAALQGQPEGVELETADGKSNVTAVVDGPRVTLKPIFKASSRPLDPATMNSLTIVYSASFRAIKGGAIGNHESILSDNWSVRLAR